MATMRAVQVKSPKGPLELVDVPIPEPGPGEVRIKVASCGVCHSDVLVKEGLWPGSGYPRIPGHELIGTIDKVAPDVVQWKPGQRVGVGWNVGYCGHCDYCRRGEFFACASKANQATGITRDGGY